MEIHEVSRAVERRCNVERRTRSANLHERIDEKLREIESDRRREDRRGAQKSSVDPRLPLGELGEMLTEVVRAMHPRLVVLGTSGGGSDYVEVLLGLQECLVEPCRIVIGLDRTRTGEDLRATIRSTVRDYLREHQQYLH